MRLDIVLLLFISLCAISVMSSFVSSPVLGTMTGGPATSPASSDNNASNTQPTVEFPTREEVAAYNMELGSEIINISNSSHGNAHDVKAGSIGNDTFVVWLGEIDGINHVFFSLSRDRGANYTQPIQLSPPGSGNASNLQLAVYDSTVDVVWQSTNLTNGTSNIIGSASMDNGSEFRSYQINAEGTYAINPVLPGNFIIIWIQCPPPPPPPPPNGAGILPTSSATTSAITNSTSTDGSQVDGGTGDVCRVYSRFGW
jgi:hypothetical protein